LSTDYLWTLTNRAGRLIACSIVEEAPGRVAVSIVLEGSEMIRESHWNEHDARARALKLREILAVWENTR
jgi:hypothetical protein